jgi:hypothetical protein
LPQVAIPDEEDDDAALDMLEDEPAEDDAESDPVEEDDERDDADDEEPEALPVELPLDTVCEEATELLLAPPPELVTTPVVDPTVEDAEVPETADAFEASPVLVPVRCSLSAQ